jgi:hypothetical protein
MKTQSIQIRLQLLLLVILTARPSDAYGQRELTDIPVPNPEVEKATFQMGDGWTAELFAGDQQQLANELGLSR